MRHFLRSLSTHRRLLADFVVRDLKGRYVGSSMGFFWSVLFPIINLFLYMFVFRVVLKTRWSDYQGPKEVILVMLVGILVWHAFAETISRTTNTLVENGNLIQKVVFPSEVLPVYLALSSLVNMTIGLPVALLGILWFGYLSPEPGPSAEWLATHVAPGDPPYQPLALGVPLVVLPLLYALQIVFAIGIGSLLATLNLYLRDTFHLVGVLVTVWMFATPIFYPAAMVEKAGYEWVLEINPMYWLIDAYRSVILYAAWPEWLHLARFLLVAAAVFALGTSFFMSQKRRFPDLL